jgi:hypothetical protein
VTTMLTSSSVRKHGDLCVFGDVAKDDAAAIE